MDTVLSTPELLEAIIVLLSMAEVLTNAKRVSHTWNNTINNSPTIQQHLFFTSKPTNYISDHKSQIWIKNPLLAAKFPAWFQDLRATSRRFLKVNDAQDRINFGNNLGPYKYYNFHGVNSLKRPHWDGMPDWEWSLRPEVFSRAEASWRKMLVTQPAVRNLKCVTANNANKRWSRIRESERFDSGLRMDFLYDLVIETLDQSSISFALQWNMFEVEENDGLREFHGDSDGPWDTDLVEKHEEPESVTLVLKDRYPVPRPRRRRPNSQTLSSDFRSKAKCAVDKDGSSIGRSLVYDEMLRQYFYGDEA